MVNDLGFDRIKPVFRDRSDLRAASNLGDSLREALDQSDALIVVCSRSAAQSKWVGEEIKHFRQKHGDSRIFSIIASDAPPECFPEALLHDTNGNRLEPIAADSRRGFDGRKNALLKTIAGLLEIDFDRLRHRDLRRQYQRMTVAATGGLAVAMITLTLAIFANDARNDANRGREQAEGLISFMLGDLRSRLEPIGQLPVLDAVGDKALEYYESLEDGELTTEVQLGRARALRQIGEVRMSQGNFDAALTAFQLSNQQAQRLADEFADSESIEFELSQSHYYIGYVHYQLMKFDLARSQWEKYLQLSQSLLLRDDNNPDYQLEVAYAHGNLGSLALQNSQFDEARRQFQSTMAINEAIVTATPEALGPKQDLVETISWLGEIESDTGNVLSAISWFQREYDLRSEIVEVSDDTDQVHGLVNSALLLGRQLMLAGKIEQAANHFQQANKLGAQLSKHDPENVGWRRLYALTNLQLSQLALIKGDLGVANEHITESIVELRNLGNITQLEAAPFREALTKALTQQARVFRALGKDGDAHEAVAEALSFFDNSEDESSSAVLIAGLRLIEGDLLASEDSSLAALHAWSSGLHLLDTLPRTFNNTVAMLVRASLLQRTDKAPEATALIAELTRLGFQDQDHTLIRALIDGVGD